VTIGWPHRLDQHGIEFLPVAAHQNVRLTFAIVDLHLKRLTGILCGPLWLLRASGPVKGRNFELESADDFYHRVWLQHCMAEPHVLPQVLFFTIIFVLCIGAEFYCLSKKWRKPVVLGAAVTMVLTGAGVYDAYLYIVHRSEWVRATCNLLRIMPLWMG
jgi:hypothetical protein